MKSDKKMNDQPIDPARSALMSRVRACGTTPELAVRRAAHALGYRFRLYRRDLPGTPDMTFPRLGKVIFVHGCFWHRHPGCSRTTTPKTRSVFWREKFERNMIRDRRNTVELRALGWEVLVIWECEATDGDKLQGLLSAYLAPPRQGDPRT